MQQNNHPHRPPHKLLGRQLKTMRQHIQESLGETSGAVEIEVEQLDRFERGAEVPSEDILMLLLSHFGVTDDEAVRLWEMAGYSQASSRNPANRRKTTAEADDEADFDDDTDSGQGHGHHHGQPAIMLLALDQRVLYSNTAEINADPAGLVINFSQNEPNGQGQYVVSRVGMSLTQAEQLVQALQRTLLHQRYMSGPPQLPPSADGAGNSEVQPD